LIKVAGDILAILLRPPYPVKRALKHPLARLSQSKIINTQVFLTIHRDENRFDAILSGVLPLSRSSNKRQKRNK
jgi:hypothetical protein